MSKQARRGAKKGLIRILVLCLLGGLLGYQLYLLNAKRLVGDTMPMPFGVGASVVLTGSMEPEISAGDLILVVRKDEYHPKQVVVYQDKGILVVHRVLSIEDGTVTTKGDANNTPDEPIPLERIKGQVVVVVPLVGHLVSLLQTPIGMLILLGSAILLMELSFRKEKNKDEDEIERIKDEIRRLQADSASPSVPVEQSAPSWEKPNEEPTND
jgi:signal peptidase